MLRLLLLTLLLLPVFTLGQNLVKPSARQLAWHKLGYYAFVHFGPNTFTGREWGEGKEDPNVFNPTNLDCRQWVRTFKAAGMKGVIITAKHHDGFCLFPSKFSTHTVAQSKWRDGKGDVLRDLSDACKSEGLKLGVYLSPWDRNHPLYGTPEYNQVFANTLTEVLTNYGPIFEVWFDGANGEGPNGKKQTYDWKLFVETVRKHQPQAVIFSDAGPDIRWVGNESGIAGETNWSTIDRSRYVPGTPLYKELTEGSESGPDWVPAEVDVSIRPGWFYRPEEDAKVRSVDDLEKIYFESVGRGANLLLNVPPGRDGQIQAPDVKSLMGLRERLDATFKKPVAEIVGREANFPTPVLASVLELGEDIRLGQSVKAFRVEGISASGTQVLARGTTIGNKRLVKFPPTKLTQVKLIIEAAKGPVNVSTFKLYSTPVQAKARAHESPEAKDKRMAWFRESRFGMFIHWGLYSIPAGTWNGKNYGGASEWLMNTAKIKPADWEPLKEQFNPVNFDAKKWVSIAKNAGMKYIVITSKHHEGFAMWPSKVGDWNIGDTKFKRDPLKELALECKKQGLKLCFYHSILDWHHPDYLPRVPWDDRTSSGADYDRYVGVLKAQLKEILTQYGPIGILWFDGEWDSTWTHERGVDLDKYVRSFQPNIIINNRVGKGRAGMSGMDEGEGVGDYGTPEQEIPASGLPGLDWESCMTMNGSWGFHANDHNWKSAEELIFNVVDCASKGGNYLLNVGPTSLGEIPDASIERLAKVGEWMKRNGEAIYGSQAGPFAKPLPWGRVTRKGNRLYLVVFDKKAQALELTGLVTPITSAHPLHKRSLLPVVKGENGPVVTIAPGEEVVVIELSGEPKTEVKPLSVDQDGVYRLNAEEADATGGIRYEGGDKKALGLWTNIDGTASWTFDAAKAGTVDVEVEVACEDESAGTTFEVVVNAEKVTGIVPKTGSWSSFVKLNLGTLNLITPGRTTLVVRAIKKPGYAVMNLRAVRLRVR
jgi:alpha-L-fucosidase